MLPANWNKMTADQKFEARLQGWLSTEGKSFATPEAARKYQANVQRYIDVIKLGVPDRVPRTLLIGNYLAAYTGFTNGDYFYDYDKAVQGVIKFHRDFDLDSNVAGNWMPGPVYDCLGYQLYRWPGGSLPHRGLDRSQAFQFVEGEYMKAEDYDALIADPEGWLMHSYTPRVFSALAGLSILPSFLMTTELPFIPFMLAPFSAPPAQAALRALLEASILAGQWFGANAQAAAVTLGELGLPGTFGGFGKAPFDFLGDSLRGTRGIMLDLYRRPQKVLAAMERLVPLATRMCIDGANGSGIPLILMVMHKGADGFMSDADFKKFYWPTFRQVLMNMIDEGVVPFMFVEGGYNSRLDIIAAEALPAGRSIWLFDQTDMAAAKQKIGSWACIAGNVPASLFKAGTPEQMERKVKSLIDTCAPGGGFFLSPGAVLDDATEENVHTYLKVGKEYGKY